MSNLALEQIKESAGFQNLSPYLIPRITKESEIKRPEGYVLPGFVALSVTAEADGVEAIGYGEGSRALAREKAISEAFERLALFSYREKSGIKETSNGWAAHRSSDLAIQAALLELIERDVALTAWEDAGPFLSVPEKFWPSPLLLWKHCQRMALEFHDLRVLLSSSLNGACVSVLLFNSRGNFVAGHASSLRIEDAILSATNECFRAAHAAIQFEHLSKAAILHASAPGSASTPEAHFVAYAYREKLPDIVRIESGSEIEIESRWDSHLVKINAINLTDLDIQLFSVGDRVVSRVKSSHLRQIFWGRTNDLTKRNLYPHFVG